MKINIKYDFFTDQELKLVRKNDKLEKLGVRINRFGLYLQVLFRK